MDYALLAEAYRQLEAAPARLKKVDLVSRLLAETNQAVLPSVANLLQGSVFPPWSPHKLGLAGNLTAKIINTVTGYSEGDIEKLYKKEGDYGLVIEVLLSKKKQRTLFGRRLTVEKVFENLQKVGLVEGKGAQERKFSLVAELVGSATPEEARYIIRTVMEELRTGVAEGVLRDAIAKAFFADVVWTDDRVLEAVRSASGQKILMENGLLESLEKKEKISAKGRESFLGRNTVSQKSLEDIVQVGDLWKEKSKIDLILLSDQEAGSRLKQDILDAVEWAWFMRPDYGEVAAAARSGGRAALKEMKLAFGMPFHVQLAEKAPSLAEAVQSFERVALEWKFDGARVQIHKSGERVWLFTRRQEDITAQFPDLVHMVHKNVSANCILEGEIVGVDRQGNPLPFQQLSQRVHRKYDIEKTAEEIPIQANLFDIVFLDGKMLFGTPFEERRKLLSSAIKETGTFRLAKQLVTSDLKAAEKFYQQALDARQEGVMVKNMDAPYQPGRRVAGGWLKVKPILETLDLCITGGTWGTGKRVGWLGSLLLGCRDPDGRFLECGMIGTGIKEKEESGGVTFDQLMVLLKPLILSEKENSVTIKPKVVVEVAYEEIQKSTNYPSGFALRFPRVLRLREDKSASEADTIGRLKVIYQQQFGKRK